MTLFRSGLFGTGQEQAAERVSGSEARDALELSRATQRRFRDQKADPDSSAALREFIIGVTDGVPQYERMVPAFAEIVRRELLSLQSMFKAFGSVQSLDFRRVEPGGADIYNVEFASDVR